MAEHLSSFSTNPAGRTAIIGAGIIGLSCAFALAIRRGLPVTLFDTGLPGQGASWAAAGMLAPAFEAAAGPESNPALLELGLQSAALWPDFARDIARASGADPGLSATPALAVALDAAEADRLDRIEQALAAKAVACRRQGPAAVRRLEPALAEGVLGGLELETDVRVDNRQVVTALIAALRASALVEFRTGAAPLQLIHGRLVIDGHQTVVLAAGWQSGEVAAETPSGHLPLSALLPELSCLKPVGGQMISLAGGEKVPRRVVRIGELYIVPRAGAVIIGATVEPGPASATPDPAASAWLHRAAARICPVLAGAPVTGHWSGTRPGTPDHAPLIGASSLPGTLIATGHYRNGVLLAPVTAEMIADSLCGDPPGDAAGAFGPRRFLAATA